ncbi:MAG: WbqC family protein [Anaerolineaceae bacterium]|nr:WbqC family protein [Anaerolineaceae bacterium]
MKCVILQPSYIPWRGYFDQIRQSDLFIFYDDMKYDKNGWRNRNRIKTQSGLQWLTIPVFNKGVEENRTPINEIKINWAQNWHRKHWNALNQTYSKAPFFSTYEDVLSAFYDRHDEFLSDFTIDLTIALSHLLGIGDTKFIRSSQIAGINGTKTDRLIQILSKVGATSYLSGPSAKDYIEPQKFSQANIELSFINYDYPEYNQLYPPYSAQVSVLDLLFMHGPQALDYF